MRYLLFSLLIITIALSLQSCGSLVYAPSMMMSDTPLKPHSAQASVAGSLLAETLPISATHFVHGGGVASLRYAFSDQFSLQTKYWNAFDSRGGASVAATIPLSDERHDFFHAEFGLAHNGNSIDGWGGALRYGRGAEISPSLQFGLSGGLMFGWNDLHNVRTGAWGAGVVVNATMNYLLCPNWTIGADLAVIWEYNHDNGDRSTLVSPTVCLGWTF